MLKVGRVNFSFAAAHYLPGYQGPCAKVHGHNYRLEAEFVGPVQSDGMVMDFSVIKNLINDIIRHLDHENLNELRVALNGQQFPNHNPTAENMIVWIADVVDGSITGDAVLNRLRLWETDNCYVEWDRIMCGGE